MGKKTFMDFNVDFHVEINRFRALHRSGVRMLKHAYDVEAILDFRGEFFESLFSQFWGHFEKQKHLMASRRRYPFYGGAPEPP